MTSRRMVALLGVPLLLAAAWALGGALFNPLPAGLGEVIVVLDRPSTPTGAPPIGQSSHPGDPATADLSSPPPPPEPDPGQPTPSDAPTGATKVTSEPAPAAGDDDDDDGDGIRDDDDDDGDGIRDDDDDDGDGIDDSADTDS